MTSTHCNTSEGRPSKHKQPGPAIYQQDTKPICGVSEPSWKQPCFWQRRNFAVCSYNLLQRTLSVLAIEMQSTLALSVLVLLASVGFFSSTSATYCRAPPRISYGGHSGGSRSSFRVGSYVTYKCNSGYTLVGRSQLTCVSSRYRSSRSYSSSSSGSSSSSYGSGRSYFWNRSPPKCIRKFLLLWIFYKYEKKFN